MASTVVASPSITVSTRTLSVPAGVVARNSTVGPPRVEPARAGPARPGTDDRVRRGDAESRGSVRHPDERPGREAAVANRVVASVETALELEERGLTVRVGEEEARLPGSSARARAVRSASRCAGSFGASHRSSGCPDRSMRLKSKPAERRVTRTQSEPARLSCETGTDASTLTSSLTPPTCVVVTSTRSRSKSRSP